MKSYQINELRELIHRILLSQGYCEEDAVISTDVLLYAEIRGNNQGLIKLGSSALTPNPDATEITIIRESKVSAQLDGGQRIGMAVVNRAVETAIQKARDHGIAVVGCSNYASATGALGVWTKKITDAGLVGIVMAQCSEMVAPQGSYEPIFGTNPFSIGVPTSPRPQILDMATSAEAWFGLVTAEAEGKSIRSDIAYDSEGRETTSPAAALSGALRVFDRSYKGSHIALMIELLAGAMTGASMNDKKESHNWGSLVIAIDPAEFSGSLEEFQRNAQIMCDRVKSAKKLEGVTEILLPGERGDRVEARNLAKGTIEISDAVDKKLRALVGGEISSDEQKEA